MYRMWFGIEKYRKFPTLLQNVCISFSNNDAFTGTVLFFHQFILNDLGMFLSFLGGVEVVVMLHDSLPSTKLK